MPLNEDLVFSGGFPGKLVSLFLAGFRMGIEETSQGRETHQTWKAQR